MNRTARRALTMAIAAPAVAGVLFAGAAPAFARADAGDSTTCTSMAMPQTSAAGVGAPNMITRAGQVGMLTPTRSPASMDGGCSAVGHN